MSDVFDDEVEGEPSISMEDYLEAVEEEELVSNCLLNSDKILNFEMIFYFYFFERMIFQFVSIAYFPFSVIAVHKL